MTFLAPSFPSGGIGGTTACPHCASIQTTRAVRASVLACQTCGSELERRGGRTIDAAFAAASATFLLLLPANVLVFLETAIVGTTRHSYLASGAFELWREGWPALAILVLVVVPPVRFGLLSLMLGCLSLGLRPGWLGLAFRVADVLQVWAMADVGLLALWIAFTRLNATVPTTLGPGGACFVAAAILIVTYLALNALSDRGVDVVVSFSKAAGARAGDTPVLYKGVRVGRVVKIRVSPDARRVDMTLRMAPETRNALRDGAKFWLIGANPSLADLSSLQAVVSGVSIGASPGTGAPQRRFVCLDDPPPVPPDVVGTPYLLEGAAIGSTRVGAGVYFHGLEMGKITRIVLTPAGRFQRNIFVSAPYDRLVRADTQFFSAKALRIEFTGSGVDGELGPGSSWLRADVRSDDDVTK